MPARTRSARTWEANVWGTSISLTTSRIFRGTPSSKALASEIAERTT